MDTLLLYAFVAAVLYALCKWIAASERRNPRPPPRGHEAQREFYRQAANRPPAEVVVDVSAVRRDMERVLNDRTNRLRMLQDEVRDFSVAQLRALLTDRYGHNDAAIKTASAEWLLAEIPRNSHLIHIALADSVAGNDIGIRGAVLAAKQAV